MQSDFLSVNRLNDGSGGKLVRTPVLQNEIAGVSIDFVSLKGEGSMVETPHEGEYVILLSLKGRAFLETGGGRHKFDQDYIVRIPYNKVFSVFVEAGDESHFLEFRKELDNDDLEIILNSSADNESLYIRSLSDCPVYTEDIKSSRTVNRMILPAGLVPRFCMGTVETTGPDTVGEHEHPMLEQHFLGMKGCKCTVVADGESLLLTENMMIHIPSGSKHSVSVAEGDILAYTWCDFFFTLKGQEYIEEQHRMEDE
jgi:quercetin dioxygenase-like cupin family protein